MKRIFYLLLLLVPFVGMAQQVGDPVTITNPGSMYTTYKYSSADADLIIKAVGRSEYSAINISSNEDVFPSGMANLDDFFDNIDYIKKYKAYYVCTIADGKVVLRIPASENSFQPSHMRPSKNIYFIMGADGVSINSSYSSSTTSSFAYASTGGIEFDSEVTVTNFGEVYPTYKLTYDDQKIVTAAVGKTQTANAVANSTEDAWPSSIKDLTARTTNRDKMYNYKLNFVANITGDKTLVIAKKSRNGHMAGGMAITHDIYFIMKSSVVTAVGSTNISGDYEEDDDYDYVSPVSTSNPYNSVVKDFGDLMSTYTFTPEDSRDIIAKVGRVEYSNIAKYATESAWPSDISTFSSRQTTRPKMYNYKLSVVCTFGDKSIVKAAAANNKHMTGGMALTHDIYFVIYTKGLR